MGPEFYKESNLQEKNRSWIGFVTPLNSSVSTYGPKLDKIQRYIFRSDSNSLETDPTFHGDSFFLGKFFG